MVVNIFSKTFSDYLKQKETRRKLTVPGTPQQNGSIERVNRGIKQIARSMLCAANLPDTFWHEAIVTAVILKNRSPTVAVKDKRRTRTLLKRTRRKQFTSIWMYCIQAYSNQKRQKWDQKSTKCILIGYYICRKAYGLRNPKFTMVHEARDVLFMEKDFDIRVADAKTIHKEINTVIPVSETEISDKEMSIERNQDLELDQNIREIVQEDHPQLRRSSRVTRVPEKSGAIT